MAQVKLTPAFILITIDRLPFCSDGCIVAALEDHDPALEKRTTVGPTLARVIKCYGCGVHLDEADAR